MKSLPIRLAVRLRTAHCGAARWVVWEGGFVRILPTPIILSSCGAACRSRSVSRLDSWRRLSIWEIDWPSSRSESLHRGWDSAYGVSRKRTIQYIAGDQSCGPTIHARSMVFEAKEGIQRTNPAARRRTSQSLPFVVFCRNVRKQSGQ